MVWFFHGYVDCFLEGWIDFFFPQQPREFGMMSMATLFLRIHLRFLGFIQVHLNLWQVSLHKVRIGILHILVVHNMWKMKEEKKKCTKGLKEILLIEKDDKLNMKNLKHQLRQEGPKKKPPQCPKQKVCPKLRQSQVGLSQRLCHLQVDRRWKPCQRGPMHSTIYLMLWSIPVLRFRVYLQMKRLRLLQSQLQRPSSSTKRTKQPWKEWGDSDTVSTAIFLI